MKLRSSVIAPALPALLCAAALAQPSQAEPPISASIVLDTSGSMGAKLALARRLLSELLKPAGSLDEFALIQASDRPVVLSGFVSAADLQAQVASTQSVGRSALLDAIYLGLQLAKTGHNARKVLLVISDGADNSSRYTETEIENASREAGVRVYAIGLYEPIASRGRTAEEVSGPAWLLQIAEHAGGRHFGTERDSDFSRIALELGAAMRARP